MFCLLRRRACRPTRPGQLSVPTLRRGLDHRGRARPDFGHRSAVASNAVCRGRRKAHCGAAGLARRERSRRAAAAGRSQGCRDRGGGQPLLLPPRPERAPCTARNVGAVNDEERLSRPEDSLDSGDAACWLSRVCQRCGGLADEEPPTTCPGCGSAIERGRPCLGRRMSVASVVVRHVTKETESAADN